MMADHGQACIYAEGKYRVCQFRPTSFIYHYLCLVLCSPIFSHAQHQLRRPQVLMAYFTTLALLTLVGNSLASPLNALEQRAAPRCGPARASASRGCVSDVGQVSEYCSSILTPLIFYTVG
jgi:hypothetical protein